MFPRCLPIAGLCALVLVSIAFALDYPVTRPADSIHPGQSGLIATALYEDAVRGRRKIVVDDASEVDPRQWLLLQRADGRLQETHCIKSINGNEIKLSEDLRNKFEGSYGDSARTVLIQGSIIRERGVVAEVVKEASQGRRRLRVDTLREIDALDQIVLQTPDGRTREAHCVKTLKIEGETSVVQIYDDLRSDFPPGSTVLQGASIGGDLEKDDMLCCCPGKAAGAR